MRSEFANINALWAELLVEELVRCGVRGFFVAPGSRSTPLAASLVQRSGIDLCVHADERGLAFLALGYAKAARFPTVLISTSGTAAAEFFPAIVEASQSGVPLLVCTADRPPELRGCGANQTIDQIHLYGRYARRFIDLPCPTLDISPHVLLSTIDQAIQTCRQAPAGPVHLNCMYRDPLAPVGPTQDFSSYLSPVKTWLQTSTAYTQADVAPMRASETSVSLPRRARGLIFFGQSGDSEGSAGAAIEIAKQRRWPILVDVGSGLRFGAGDAQIITHSVHLLRHERLREQLRPEVVLHCGGASTSGVFEAWLADNRPPTYVRLANTSDWSDPIHQATHYLASNSGALLRHVAGEGEPADAAWLEQWRSADACVRTGLDKELATAKTISEPGLARVLTSSLAAESCLFLGNSMPIRDVDAFGAPNGTALTIVCNRGASGIDGNVATAIGFARARRCPMTLLIGDLALLYDLNSLALCAASPAPVTIIAINNNGGGIFSFLPIAQRNDIFERAWGTPHGLEFSHAAAMFGLTYKNPTTLSEFCEAVTLAQKQGRTLIEVKTDRAENLSLHRELSARINRELDVLVRKMPVRG